MNLTEYEMNTQSIALKIDQFLLAWQTHAADKKFLGCTVAEAAVILAPVKAVREQLAVADSTYTGLIASRTEVDNEALAFMDRLVNAVRAEVGGPNSPIYRAMGFVTLEERRTGLTRNGETSAAPLTNP